MLAAAASVIVCAQTSFRAMKCVDPVCVDIKDGMNLEFHSNGISNRISNTSIQWLQIRFEY